jgi:hypothetical protein
MKIANPEAQGFSGQRLARINTVMQRYIDEQQIAGITTLIARRGQVVHFEKFGMAVYSKSPASTSPKGEVIT